MRHVSLLEAVEGGKVGLPRETILRPAAVPGRSDPILVATKRTRGQNPKLWMTLEGSGIRRLPAQPGREFANIHRASDAARQLNDEESAAAPTFVRASLEAALALRAETGKAAPAAVNAPSAT